MTRIPIQKAKDNRYLGLFFFFWIVFYDIGAKGCAGRLCCWLKRRHLPTSSFKPLFISKVTKIDPESNITKKKLFLKGECHLQSSHWENRARKVVCFSTSISFRYPSSSCIAQVLHYIWFILHQQYPTNEMGY